MSPPLRLPQTPKSPHNATSGSLRGSNLIVHREKDGSETIHHETHRQSPPIRRGAEYTAMAGVELGLTIPGPERSYKAARVNAVCYLPSLPTQEGVRQTLKEADELVTEYLVAASAEIKQFFNEK